jgi:hypothetical protein
MVDALFHDGVRLLSASRHDFRQSNPGAIDSG